MGDIQNLLMTIPASIVACEALYVKRIKNFFSQKILIKASSISLAVYILHWPIFCSIGLYLLMTLGLNDNYAIHAMIVIAVTTPICILGSWFFHNTIERFVNFAVKKV